MTNLSAPGIGFWRLGSPCKGYRDVGFRVLGSRDVRDIPAPFGGFGV